MKILHLVHRYWPSFGGAEKSFQLLSESFAGEGHRVTLYTTDARDYRYFWQRDAAHLPAGLDAHKGVRIVRFPVRRLPGYGAPGRGPGGWRVPAIQRWLAHSPWLPSLIRTSGQYHGDYQVVHASSLPVNVILHAGCRISRRSGIPLIISPHLHTGERIDRGAVFAQYTSEVQLDILRRAEAVIAKTPGERRLLIDLGLTPRRVLVVPNGIDLDEMAGGRGRLFRERHGITGFMVLHIAHKSVLKGTRDLVEAMILLWRRGSETTLVLAGSTEPGFGRYLSGIAPEFRRRIIELEDPDEEEKRDALAAQDLFVLPSKVDSFGYVFLESWYYDKPVIGAMAGGVKEVIRDGRDGFLVPFGHPHVLAEYIHRLEGDPALCADLGRAGGRRVREEFDWKRRVFPMYEELYRRLARGSNKDR